MSEDSETKPDSTIKPANDKRIKLDTLKKAPQQKIDLSRQDLIRLLSYLEGELQARDIVIATIKSETAKQLLYQAKYGRLGLSDPLAALQRDSEACASTDDFDEGSVGRMYESQLGQLEKLITVQRRAHHRAKQVLAAAERRHARTVRELDDERQRRAQDAAQGDDVCMMLEKERERLKQEIEMQKTEHEKLEKELEKMKQQLVEEKDRRKEIVLYLLQERRQLMIRLMEERLKVQNLTGAPSQQGASSSSSSSSSKEQQDNLIKKLKAELETTKSQLDKERDETASLREIVQTQENDLNLIRQTILAKTRQQQQQQFGNNNQQQQQQQPQPPASLHIKQTTTSKNSGGKQQAPFPPASTSSATVRYQILTRPAAPGTSELSKYSSAPTGVDHVSASSPVQSPSPTIRLLNPAFQQQQQQQQQQHSPQLSPQPKQRLGGGIIGQPPPYSALDVTNIHYTTSAMKQQPQQAIGQQYASAGHLMNSPSYGGVARRPVGVSSPVKSSPTPVGTSSSSPSSLLNGYSSAAAKRPIGNNGPLLSLSGGASRGPPPTQSSAILDSDSSFRLGSTPPSRVALTQLPPSGNFAFGGGGGQRSTGVTTADSSSSGTARRKAPSGSGDSQQQVRITNLHNNNNNNNAEEKLTRNGNSISESSTSTEPEIAHLEAVINSMGHVNSDDVEFADDCAEEYYLISSSSSGSDNYSDSIKVSENVVAPSSSSSSSSFSSNNNNNSHNSRTPGIVDESVDTSSTVNNSAIGHNNTWSSSSTTLRRFPTTTSAPVIFNRSAVSTSVSVPSPPHYGTVIAGGKRAPTPSPSNRIPLPLNGALTKSLSTGSASPTPTSSHSSGGGSGGAQALGQRVTKAVSGIAGKVQKKIVPNVKRPAADQPVRSTQV